MSKVVERVLKKLLEPFLEKVGAFGQNQFAYRAGRGSRDALAFLVLKWITVLNARGKVAVYCSDVKGAFDNVNGTRLADKLHSKEVCPTPHPDLDFLVG